MDPVSRDTSIAVVVSLFIGATTVLAQSADNLPNPADPGAAVPLVGHESAFADYRPFQEQKDISWKKVNQEVADNPGMGSMKHMADEPMAGMDSKAGGAQDHAEMALAKPQTAAGGPADPQTAGITGTGIVQDIDKANGKVKLVHDPIAALGWPKMTMFFRLKDSALADQVKKGDKVEFSLEKSASGYVISGFQKAAVDHDMKQMKK